VKKQLLAGLLLAPLFLLAQNDSTLLLAPERLEMKDILFRDLSQQEVKVISATRSPEEIDEQPFTVWVITGEEILRNGFVTLADVMRAAPGVRVSQPGNAVEGEMFLMRGLSGNQYAKILINDVPIKPAIAGGMPIGAQLPIRQAERIEVVYGPSGALYGEEACVGVINIILKETERPVFTQADLSFGRYSYNSLDLMFGGKLGRDKNIFRYSIYGSSTVRENSDYFYDQNLFNTNKYLSFGLDTSVYTSNGNYRGANFFKDSIARTGALPHESRMFGVNLTWRGIHFTYHRMARFDRSALGLNTLAVSYANPSNRLSERMETFSLGFQRKRKKRVTQNTFSFESYQINNTSTTTYVFDRLSAAAYHAEATPGMTDSSRSVLLQDIYNRYAADEKFAAANGFDARIESRLSAALGTRLFMTAGGQVHLGGGVPLSTYYPVPVSLGIDGVNAPTGSFPVDPYSSGLFDINLFAQLERRGKRLNLVGGGSFNAALSQGLFLSPRFGFVYKIDSTWSVRGNASTGFRHASLYGYTNSYLIFKGIDPAIDIGSQAFNSERFYSGELGMRYHKGGVRAELLAFLQQANFLYQPGYLVSQDGTLPAITYGYDNAPEVAHVIWGIQALFKSESKEFLSIDGFRKKGVISGKTELYLQYARGNEWYGYNVIKTNEVLNQPKWTTQFRTFFKINKNVEIVIAANKQSSSLSKSVLYQEQFQLKNRGERLKKFATWDLIGRVYLSNHFLVYCNFQNIFDREFAGLDATGTQDDLLYNPQPGRFVRFGVNYNMN
jgi:outer membrane receptor protein involved in Fe transport